MEIILRRTIHVTFSDKTMSDARKRAVWKGTDIKTQLRIIANEHAARLPSMIKA